MTGRRGVEDPAEDSDNDDDVISGRAEVWQMVRRSPSGAPTADDARGSSDPAAGGISQVESPGADEVATASGGWTVRRASRQLTRFVADGTGRSEAEVRVLVVAGAVPVLVAGTVAASRGALRLIDFLVDG